ncbi:DUF692 domain-containing protein [Roseateles sp. SL47]|uniref:MNIO family bufferin maturase n=1 Tax=Roseateles sp. SL47 TaxID=2995138 RepID=UPI002270B673|nr:DUF692 domain-containing protein [Roseateles sp. SL47]WAC72577.1 DUF692 domain-containing protein [Roseateles sp. SL47]
MPPPTSPTSQQGERWRLPEPGARQRLAGAGFKPEHLSAILADRLPNTFFEVHAENYMGAGGPPHRALTALRERFALSVHGVGMSIGGPGPLDAVHLHRFAALVQRYQPAWVSEHLAWSSHGGHFYNDLLPLPYTAQTLQGVCDHIDQVQNTIGRALLIENPSTYLRFDASDMTEAQFLTAVVQRTGCGLLLDVNNAHVSAVNHGFSAWDYLLGLPLSAVREVHLAGHSEQQDDEAAPLLIDSHDRAVSPEVWALYAALLQHTGPVATLIEWDSDLPSWPVLKAQMQQARDCLDAAAEHSVEPQMELCHED